MNESTHRLGAKIEAAANHLVVAMAPLLVDPTQGEDPTITQQLGTAVALLARFAGSDSCMAAAQFSGWLRIMARQHPTRFKDVPFAAVDLEAVWQGWRVALRPRLSAAEMSHLEGVFAASDGNLCRPDSKPVRVLFVGDCLLWDIALQLQVMAAAKGITIDSTIRAQRVGADLRRALTEFSPDQFDLVFYSPFSYEFSADYAFVTAPRNIFRLPRRGDAMLQNALRDVRQTIYLMAKRFDCPLHVHRVSGLRQMRPGWLGRVSAWLSAPQRCYARRRLNEGLDSFLDGLNHALERPVLRVDELGPIASSSAVELGLAAFDAGELHPTRLAQELAKTAYLQASTVVARLLPRKLIVCDLDNTLWEGVIGDGPVRHHLDRQATLKRLKEGGIVLAISSKNDPVNVRWDHASLGAEDFVTAEINWNPKSSNIRRIADVLNLDPGSFVFLDDRPDEREMVASAMPAVLALDPNDQATWDLLNLWADMGKAAALLDRTGLYKERAKRQEYLDRSAPNSDDVEKAYGELGLKVSLRNPSRTEMHRVVELINRTNQFNTTGTRTTLAQLSSGTVPRIVLLAEARDKFGSMGIIGAMAVERGSRPLITHFVLSCRVFGFAIEDAMLNSVLRGLGDAVLAASLVETPVNKPCRDVYLRNGFEKSGDFWLSRGVAKADPPWLSIDDHTQWTDAVDAT